MEGRRPFRNMSARPPARSGGGGPPPVASRRRPAGALPMVDLTNDSGDDDDDDEVVLPPRSGNSTRLVASVRRGSGGRTAREVSVTVRWGASRGTGSGAVVDDDRGRGRVDADLGGRARCRGSSPTHSASADTNDLDADFDRSTHTRKLGDRCKEEDTSDSEHDAHLPCSAQADIEKLDNPTNIDAPTTNVAEQHQMHDSMFGTNLSSIKPMVLSTVYAVISRGSSLLNETATDTEPSLSSIEAVNKPRSLEETDGDILMSSHTSSMTRGNRTNLETSQVFDPVDEPAANIAPEILSLERIDEQYQEGKNDGTATRTPADKDVGERKLLSGREAATAIDKLSLDRHFLRDSDAPLASRKKTPPSASPMFDLTIDSGDDDDIDLLRGGVDEEEDAATDSGDGGGPRSPSAPLVASLRRGSGGRTTREVRVTVRWGEVEVASRPDHHVVVPAGGEKRTMAEHDDRNNDNEDKGDPPFRRSGHPFLGRRVRYFLPFTGDNVGIDGTVTGYLSPNDVDSDGRPAFKCSRTLRPAALFHVVFDEDNSQMRSADLEESELEEECLWLSPLPKSVVGEGVTKKSNKDTPRSTQGRKRGRPGEARPEVVASNGKRTPAAGGGGFDEDDYVSLHSRYLMPRIREKVELAGGITLRRQFRGRILDQNTPGFRLLRSRVDALTRKSDHVEVYRLLCQLRNWELDPRRVPTAFRDAGDEDVAEVLDLTNDDDDRPSSACIDVDEYIVDVLLVPLGTSSSFTPHHTPSSQNVHRVSPSEEPADACNQRFRESKSSSSNCQSDAQASTIKDHHQQSPSLTVESVIDESLSPVQMSHCGIKELEAYAYAVIETVSHECYTTNGVHTMTTMDEPRDYLRAAPDQVLPACSLRKTVGAKLRMIEGKKNTKKKIASVACNETNLGEPWTCKCAGQVAAGRARCGKCHCWKGGKRPVRRRAEPKNYITTSPSSSPPGLRTPMHRRSPTKPPKQRSVVAISDYSRWNDLPKPPGQLTINECRGFYVQGDPRRRSEFRSSGDQSPSTQPTTVGVPAPGILSYEGRVKETIEILAGCNSVSGAANNAINHAKATNFCRGASTDDITDFIRSLTQQQHNHVNYTNNFQNIQGNVGGTSLGQNKNTRIVSGVNQNFGGIDDLINFQNQTAPSAVNLSQPENFGPSFQQLNSQFRWTSQENPLALLPSFSNSFLEHGPDLFPSDGLGEQLNWPIGTAHAFTQQPHPRVFACPLPKSSADPILHPEMLPPKLDPGTFISGAQPSSPLHGRTRVSQVVTPEAGRQKPRKKKKQQQQLQKFHVDTNPAKMLHFPTRVGTFSVTNFGFPTIQSTSPFSQGKCSSVRKGRRRLLTIESEGTSRRQYFNCCSTKTCADLHHVRPTFDSITFSVIPASRLLTKEFPSINAAPECLREQWNLQSTLRRSGRWTPNGHLTGRWKPPEWAVAQSHRNSNDDRGVHIQKQKKHPGCRKSLLPALDSLVLNFAAEMRMSCDYKGQHRTSVSLRDVVCPQYARPTINLLCSAHSAVESLLPKGDCEDWEVVAMAWRYYDHWRPRETKVILLAESHAFTPKVSSPFVF